MPRSVASFGLMGLLALIGCSGKGGASHPGKNAPVDAAGLGGGGAASGNGTARDALGIGGTGIGGAQSKHASTAGSAPAGGAGTAGSSSDAGSPDASKPIEGLRCGAECDALGFECVNGDCKGPNGALLWQQRIDDRFVDYAGAIASDSLGNAVIGFSMESRTPEASMMALHLRKLGPRGELLWDDVLDGGGGGAIQGVAVDASDRVYAVGMRSFATTSAGTNVSFLRVLDAGGHLIEQIEYPYAELRTADGVAIDSQGNIWIAGSIGDQEARPLAVRKLDARRQALWTRTYHMPGSNWRRFYIAIRSDGDAMVAGGMDAMPPEAWVAVLDPSGAEVSSDAFHGADQSIAVGVARGPDDELWAIGSDYQHPSWLRRYAANGKLISQPTLPDPPISAAALAVAPDGRAYVGGMSYTDGSKMDAWISEVTSAGSLGWQFLDPKDTYPFDRTVHALALTPSGDLLVLGQIDMPSNRGVWLARFAGPNGGVPNPGADSLAALTRNSFPDHDGSPVFTDPGLPACAAGNFSQYALQGELDGSPINIDQSAVQSQLNTSDLELLTVVQPMMVRNDLVLKWAKRPIEGQSIPLTGGQLWIPETHPSGGQFLCITKGDVGFLPAVYNRMRDGRALDFRIEGGRLGQDCSGASSGAEISANLYGCMYRTNSYIP